MRYILGGGLIALLARDILGSGWTLVPIGKSRFYSFTPPLADHYVLRDDVIDAYMKKYSFIPLIYKTGYSYGGPITYNTKMALPIWLKKVYGDKIPDHASAYWSRKIEHFGYGDCIAIYRELQQKFAEEIRNNAAQYGKPVSIANHTITTDAGARLPYERLISTVPLTALAKWMGLSLDLPTKTEYYYHVVTNKLDFEGATTLHVVDPEIEFFKVRMLNKTNYIFHALNQIQYPGRYLQVFMPEFELIGETSIEGAICCGSMPNMPTVLQPDIAKLKAEDVVCMGSTAVHDDCLDVGSCIRRLIKYD